MIEKLADLYEKLIPVVAVFSLLVIEFLAIDYYMTSFYSTANLTGTILVILVAFVFWLSCFGLLAIVVMMHRHLKSIESKLDSK